VRGLREYYDWRLAVFVRDNFICQICRMRGGDIHAHHIKHFNIIIKENNLQTIEEAIKCNELWFVSNGITVCEKCHQEEHKEEKILRKNITEDAFD
jgi:5-methylcytosine-specific restriction endonuclease McrA